MNEMSVEEVAEQLAKKVMEIFDSEKYRIYLSTMAKFTNYSANNCLLIGAQCPDATVVAGYRSWETNFHRRVKKGEKGIRILAPAPKKKWVTQECMDEAGHKIFNADGSVQTEQVQVVIPAYRAISVYDISQTEGEPLPSLVHRLEGAVDKDLIEATSHVISVPIRYEAMTGEMNGYYDMTNKYIAVREDAAPRQRLKTILHEWAHCRLHDPDTGSERDQLPDQRKREVEAESIAYVVCQHLGVDTSDYSFGYIAGWSEGKDCRELQASLQLIQTNARAMIRDLEEELERMQIDRSDRIGYTLPDGRYMIVEREEERFRFQLLDGRMQVLDAGIVVTSSDGIQAAADQAMLACGEEPQAARMLGLDQLDRLLDGKGTDEDLHCERAVGLTM